MIRKNKDLEDIPLSLRTDVDSVAKNPARTTNKRRLELIDAGHYIDSREYNDRYKLRDIKEKLALIYPTCCFCGIDDQQLEVEHYRPKSKYHWLAYSWDNLLLSCTVCNKAKKAKFSISGSPVPPKTDRDVTNINCLSCDYDAQEKPLLINPETVTEEELAAFSYHKDGHVSSDNPRVNYTITTCGLDRKNLVERRRTIWDKFNAAANQRIYEHRNDPEGLKISIADLVKDFIRDSNDLSLPFTAFRRYAIEAGWLQSLADDNNH